MVSEVAIYGGCSQTLTSLLEDKLKTIGVFLDLSKAFDNVFTPIRLYKIKALVIRGIA